MKTKYVKWSLLLIVVLLLNSTYLVSCKSKNQTTESNLSDNSISATDSTQTESETTESTVSTASVTQQSAITQSQAQEEIKKLDLKGASIKLLTSWDANGADARLLKTRFKDYCNGTIIISTSPYEQMATKLISLEMSNDSPDIYMVRNQDFPAIMYKDVFQILDDKIDFNSAVWAPNKPRYDKYIWMGKHYLIGDAGPARYIWYNKRMMEESGVAKTPGDLVKENNWNWDTFLALAKEMTDTKTSTYGFSESGFNYALMSAYNEDIIKISSNGIESNIGSANVAKAMQFYSDLYVKFKVASPKPENRLQDFANGKIAMIYDGHWFANSDPLKTLQDKGEISFTHIPKAPGAANYSYPTEFSGVAIPKGAKNLKGAIAYLTMGEISTAYAEEENRKWHQTSNHNAEQIAVTDFAMKNQFNTPIFSYGINGASTAYWTELTALQAGTPWTTIVERLNPKVIKAIDDLKK